jgi:hypothetical protein
MDTCEKDEDRAGGQNETRGFSVAWQTRLDKRGLPVREREALGVLEKALVVKSLEREAHCWKAHHIPKFRDSISRCCWRHMQDAYAFFAAGTAFVLVVFATGFLVPLILASPLAAKCVSDVSRI